MSSDKKQICIADEEADTCSTLRTFLDIQKQWINVIEDISVRKDSRAVIQ